MSTTKQAQPGQERPKPASVVGAHNLDTLQSMLNLVLISSGRFIKEHQSGGGSGKMKIEFERAVPVASERFHDALDELENEVRLAQIVLRRDLALMKQERKKREVAAKEKEAEKARMAAESKGGGTAGINQEAKIEKVSTPVSPPAPVVKEPENAVKQEKALKREEEKVAPPPPPPPPIETTIAPPTERDPLFDGTPTTANAQDEGIDFDAMFGDAMDSTGDHNNNDNGDMMDTSGDMGFTFDEGPSLLRGLEDFANAKSSDNDNPTQSSTNMDLDITMPDLPDLSTEAKAAAELPVAAKAPEPSAAQPAAEASNDDLMGDMAANNLDDLFNMDEYENPEQSSFDDAFFNFDN